MALEGHRYHRGLGWASSRYSFPASHVFSRAQRVREASATRRISMLDVIVLALGLGFFVAAVGYTYACERL
jgi:hypothetical protein